MMMTSPLLVLGLLVVEAVDAGAASDAGGPVEPIDADIDADLAAMGKRRDARDAGAGEAADARDTARVRGRLMARGSRGPVMAAKIVAVTPAGVVGSAEGDDLGGFELAIPCGTLDLTASAPGYEPLALRHDACGDRGPLLLRLVPRSNLPLYETVVVAPRDEPSVALRGPELTTTPGSLGDPFRTLESLPGVAVVAWPAPIYAVRGANPGNTGFFLDEVRVPLLFHLALGPSVIHPAFFDSMAFYPGGYPASYGRFVGGIVAAQTRPPAEDRPHGVVDLRLYDASVLGSTPFPDGNGSVAAAFRYSYTGPLVSLVRNDVGLAYWDYQLRADRRVGGWRLGLFVFGAADDLEYRPAQPDLRRAYHLKFHRAAFRARTTLGAGQVRASVAFGADQTSAPVVASYVVNSRAYSILPRLSYERQVGRTEVVAGLDGQIEWLRPASTVHEAGASDLVRDRLAVLLAGFTSAHIPVGSRLTLTPGLRLDRYSVSGATRTDLGPRLSARFVLAPATWLSASGGRFSQAPSLTIDLPATQNFGLAIYGLQTAWQGSLGVGTSRLGVVDVEVTGFIQRYVLTDLGDPTLTRPDPVANDFVVRRDARSYGMELMIRRPASERLHGWLAYTLSRSQRAMGAGVIAPSDWDQRHILTAVIGYRFGRTTLGVRGHLHSGRPVLVGNGQSDAFVRLPAFYQLDLRVERRVLFNSFSLQFYAEVVNTTLSRETYGYYQNSVTGAQSPQSLRLMLPSLGIRGEI